MPFLNADIPTLYTYLRAEYLYDLRSHHGEYEEVAVFGVTSIPARALMFSCMTAGGAQIDRLPISAFTFKEHEPDIPLDHLQLWDAFSHDIGVIEYDYLKMLRCRTILKDRTWHMGTYMFTVDWTGNALSDEPGEGGHKSGHTIQLDCGCIAIQPNNRIQWFEPSFITRPWKRPPAYLTNSHRWHCEGLSKWKTEDTDAFFYEVEHDADSG